MSHKELKFARHLSSGAIFDSVHFFIVLGKNEFRAGDLKFNFWEVAVPLPLNIWVYFVLSIGILILAFRLARVTFS